MLPHFKNGWCLMKTIKTRPMGYLGYIFTLYEADDITVKVERKARTAGGIWREIVKLARKENNV